MGEYKVEFIADELSTYETTIEHLNGIPWFEAPIPRRLHHCRIQTRGWINYLAKIERCACGAIRMNNDKGWSDKNSRRK